MKRPGNQTLTWTDGGGTSHQTDIPAGLAARQRHRRSTQALAALRSGHGGGGGSDSDGAPFTAAAAQLHLRRDPKGDALDLMVSGDDIKDQGSIAGLFGDHIKSLALYATLTRARLLRRCWRAQTWPDGCGGLAARAARWQSGR